MSTSPADDLSDILETANLIGGSTGWLTQVGEEPTNPDKVVTLYDTGGPEPNPKNLQDFVRVQIRIRGNPNDYLATFLKAQQIKDELLGRPKATINSVVYVGIWMANEILFLGYDESRRPRFTCNWRIVREPPDASTHRSPF
jgi:hypothetical protein